MVPIVQMLISSGMSLLANVVKEKGKQWLEAKTGVDLSKADMSPEDLLKLKQYEMDNEAELQEFQLEKLRLGVELIGMDYKDGENARALQVSALQQEDLFSKRYLYYFSSFWSLFAVTYAFAITFINVPEDGRRFADTILGLLIGTVVSQIFSYFYGTNKSSSNKDAIIAKLSGGGK